MGDRGMLLGDLRVLELGEGLAGSVCGRLFAELGAEVLQLRPPAAERPPLSTESRETRLVTDALKREIAPHELQMLAPEADLVIASGRPADLERYGWTPEALRSRARTAVVATITPFGWVGPYRDRPASDLTIFHASGLSRLLLGAVTDPEREPPVRAAGEQSEFISGIAAAVATMAALHGRARSGAGATIDVSAHEALASMAARELASPALGAVPSSRRRHGDVLGASVVLPASDGWVSISPREAHQWVSWVRVMGAPRWTRSPRFRTHADRLERADELIPLMSAWSRGRTRAEIYELAQAAHVPCFPVNRVDEVLEEGHFRARGTLRPLYGQPGRLAPAPPFGIPERYLRQKPPAEARFSQRPEASSEVPDPAPQEQLPLAGIRVLDFSWVIAGPTTTWFLAALGAEVVKVESPERPDPGRRTALHRVLGRSKLNLGIDLKAPGAREAVLKLASRSDVVLENFASGVMDRLGVGEEELSGINPDLVFVSSSGLGRTGPGAETVAYGTLVQCFVAFADLNGFPDHPPSPGFAWSDPLCGMLLAFSATAALYGRDHSGSDLRRIDHSMAEALLWTMPGSLLAAQAGRALPRQLGNRSRDFAPHDLYRCAGEDRWLAIAATCEAEWRALASRLPQLRGVADLNRGQRLERRVEVDRLIAAWAALQDGREAMEELQRAGIPCAATFDTQMLFEDTHLWGRQFYEPVAEADGETQFLPGLPWRWPGGTRIARAAVSPGADDDDVLERIAGLSQQEIADLRRSGALTSAAAAAAPR